jgi:hypothetical protein
MNMDRMQSAQATSLRTDSAYTQLLEAQSVWPFLYHFARTNPVNSRPRPIQGLWSQGVPPADVPQFNRLLPSHFRVKHRASQNRPQTELFGTAPYRALGRGTARHVDASSALLVGGDWAANKGSRSAATEAHFDRSYFVSIPVPLRRLETELRYGASTRMSPAYAQPHDEE